MSTDPQVPPVSVHVASSDVPMGGTPRRKVRQVKVITKNLTATTPVVDLVGYDETRLYIQVQAGGSNIVICTDLSQAQDPANQVPGVPNPNGLLLSAGNTVPWKLEGCGRMWAVGNTFPSQVTYSIVHESP
jgi:hypothetical protein